MTLTKKTLAVIDSAVDDCVDKIVLAAMYKTFKVRQSFGHLDAPRDRIHDVASFVRSLHAGSIGWLVDRLTSMFDEIDGPSFEKNMKIIDRTVIEKWSDGYDEKNTMHSNVVARAIDQAAEDFKKMMEIVGEKVKAENKSQKL